MIARHLMAVILTSNPRAVPAAVCFHTAFIPNYEHRPRSASCSERRLGYGGAWISTLVLWSHSPTFQSRGRKTCVS
jgi:hypothetical protein